MRESLKVLDECAKIQIAKSHDYQNAKSTVKQIDYYPNGLMSIWEEINKKNLRMKSLLQSGEKPKNESLEDSAKDMINYCSFFVEFLRGKMEGQEGYNGEESNEEQLLLEFGIDTNARQRKCH